MSKDRRMTADRFYGGVHGRLQNLRQMLSHVNGRHPSENDLVEWVITNTPAESEDAVKKHLGFLEAISLIQRKRSTYRLGNYGQDYHENADADVLYEALTSGVKGFRTILRELENGPMSDEDVMNLLTTSYEECEMTTPGPALRHREWLQTIGYIERDNGTNRITNKGRAALGSTSNQQQIKELQRQLRLSDMQCVPHGAQHLSYDVYPATQSAYPSLCNDDYRCENAHNGGKDQAEWKHAVRNVLKQLAEDDRSRVRQYDERGVWMFTPRFRLGKQYRRKDLHDRYGGMRQSGIAPSREVPVIFIFTGDTGELYGYKDEFRDDGTLIYTGEGQVGDMTYDRGNKVLGEHQKEGRELHVFRKEESELVTYLGQYIHGKSFRETLPDREGNDREGIRFKLNPIDEVEVDSPVALPEGNSAPERTRSVGKRVQRDEKLVQEIKWLYNDTCQLCGDRRLQGDDIGYSYVHHIKPLAKQHGGPDVPENIIVLCPNHHDDFDNGMLTVDPDTLEITHAYEAILTGETVTVRRGHKIASQFLAYHNQTIATE